MELKLMKRTTAKYTIFELRQIFAVFGLPNQLVADNGPPFGSAELGEFLKSNSVQPIISPPYQPPSSGLAERAVQTAKSTLKKELPPVVGTFDLKKYIDGFLLKYRTTPCTTTGMSPTKIMFKIKHRTRLDLLKPPLGQEKFKAKYQPAIRREIKLFAEGEIRYLYKLSIHIL